MSVAEVISIIKGQMQEVRNSLVEWINTDGAILNYQPVDGGWTAVQILEHIMLTNHFLLLIIDKAVTKARKRSAVTAVDQDWVNYELVPKLLSEVGIHKSFIWNRPGHMEPKGNVSLAEIEGTIMGQLDRCAGHLDHLKSGEGTLCKTTMTVNGIGKLDVYQYIYFLIAHSQRHIIQLEKNKEEFQLGR
jgi:DinB superfamily